MIVLVNKILLASAASIYSPSFADCLDVPAGPVGGPTASGDGHSKLEYHLHPEFLVEKGSGRA
jgi:hypothetical protein